MDRDPRKMAGLRSLLARLSLDADLGVEFVAGTGGDFHRIVDELAKEASGRARRAEPVARTSHSGQAVRPTQTAQPVPPRAPAPPVRPAPAAREAAPVLVAPRPAEGHVSLVPYVPPPANAEKEALLADLRRESESCCLCGLCERRNSVVWGEGSLDADVMFIGEGPGRDEDVEGRPFVGRSGRLLTDIIEKGMGRPRSSVYIANVVKCRPPGNRDPRPEETAACARYLDRQIGVVKPAVIVAVGMVAARALLGLPPGTSGLRNEWLQHGDIPLRVIYHPSYLLRLRQSERDRTDADKATWRDIQDVMKKVAELRGV